jgi:hypothetical protein
VIAALYVQRNGVYYGLDGVDPWDEKRDARLYNGPWPVVAHPPCAAWCRLAGLREHKYGYKRGEDGGAFAAALAAVRKFGGILEHPAHSDAWKAYGLLRPVRGKWSADDDGAVVTEVSQSAYGHRARKRTWLYAVNATPADLDWSEPPTTAVVSGSHNHYNKPIGNGARVWSREASRTPTAFRDLLISIARSVQR